MKTQIPDNTHTTINRICTEAGAYLIDLLAKGSKAKTFLEIVIDTEEGVTHDLCKSISRTLDECIEKDVFLHSLAGLEVSSPGVDRPLTYTWQYTKHIGRDLKVFLTAGGTMEGILQSIDNEGITLERKKPKSKKQAENFTPQVFIQFDDIKHSIVQLRWK